MNLRRTILALALVVLAGLVGWISFTPAAGTGQLVLLGIAAFTVVAAIVLFVWRRVGSVLAILAGGAGFLFGAVLAGLAGFGGQQAEPEVLAAIYLGAGTGIFALIDLIMLMLAKRPTGA